MSNLNLPAVGRGKMAFQAAFAAWCRLVLQDEARSADWRPNFSANILEMLAGDGNWDLVSQAIDRISGRWAPLGYGSGPASYVRWPEEEDGSLTFGWAGYWTQGRWIEFRLPRVPADVQSAGEYNSWLYGQEVVVEWDSATGQSSSFVSSVLEGIGEVEERVGEEWRAHVAPILPAHPRPGRGRD